MEKRRKDRVVIVGGGGREHALAWKLAQSPQVGEIYCLPGNPGMADVAECLPVPVTDIGLIVQTVFDLQPQLVVVGPEAPLVAGLADVLRAEGVAVFGPSAAAAQIEGSKSFAKRLMERAGVPTASFYVTDDMKKATRHIDARKATRFLDGTVGNLVVKADGLCGGKGVVVCTSKDQALAAAHAMLVERIHGEAGARIVIEDRLFGQEISVMALVDGEHVLILPTAQDYKRRENGDVGPMTGGMGCMSPSPFETTALLGQIRETIFAPTVRTMAAEGTPFRGLLYAGLMLTETGPMVLEFNCRFGDPETQVVLPRLDADLYELLSMAASEKGFPSMVRTDWTIPTKPSAAVCVVQCADSYPEKGSKGQIIGGLETADDHPLVTVFHAGTARDPEGRIVTNGGRVLGTTALGNTIAQARRRAYETVGRISWDGEAHRTDIAAGV